VQALEGRRSVLFEELWRGRTEEANNGAIASIHEFNDHLLRGAVPSPESPMAAQEPLQRAFARGGRSAEVVPSGDSSAQSLL
jgi:hypothetical protein